jgi:RNase H-fold protein (predicted Holliday junction resolvase)
MQDEAATSRQAESELQARGKPYSKEDIDALSATYILEDFISEQVNL